MALDRSITMANSEISNMQHDISHDRDEETSAGKARWFLSLTPEERLDYLDEIVDLALAVHPEILEQKNVEQAERRVQIIEKSGRKILGDRGDRNRSSRSSSDNV